MEYESPTIQGRYINLKQVDYSRLVAILKNANEPKVFKQKVKALNGGFKEVENSHHPENEKRQAEYRDGVNRLLVNFYLLFGTEFQITDKINQEISDKLADILVIEPEFEIGNRRLFYFEWIFTETAEQLGELVALIRGISSVDRESALEIAYKFRLREWRPEYLQPRYFEL